MAADRKRKVLHSGQLTQEQTDILSLLDDPEGRIACLGLITSAIHSAVRDQDSDAVAGAFGMLAEAMRQGKELPRELIQFAGWALQQALRSTEGRSAIAGTYGKKGNKKRIGLRARNNSMWLEFRERRKNNESYNSIVSELARRNHKSESTIRSIIDPLIASQDELDALLRYADALMDACRRGTP